MPHVKVTGVIVSHFFEDGSHEDVKISAGEFKADEPYVSLELDGDTFYFRPESWPEIRAQIQAMFDESGEEHAGD